MAKRGIAHWFCALSLAACTRADPATAPGSVAPLAEADAGTCAPGERQTERDRMVRETIELEGVDDARVLAVMRRVPRHRFVLQSERAAAYQDRPLPIVGDQTISQPFIVAYMTSAAAPRPGDKCLEIGTGSGYQAAILAELCGHTYTVEYLPDVARFGAENLRACGYGPDRVELRVGDGYRGWSEAAPFDVIIVTAAPVSVPEPLLDQLRVGGRLVVPVGAVHDVQVLERWRRLRAGSDVGAFARERLLPVRFVPFLDPQRRDGNRNERLIR
jgi:protein-L-isoaspartate(D-aspartate) O-methyltransferase